MAIYIPLKDAMKILFTFEIYKVPIQNEAITHFLNYEYLISFTTI